MVEVMSKKHIDQSLIESKESVLGKLNESFSLGVDGIIRYQGILCVPNVDGLRNQILKMPMGPVTPVIRVRQKFTT